MCVCPLSTRCGPKIPPHLRRNLLIVLRTHIRTIRNCCHILVVCGFLCLCVAAAAANESAITECFFPTALLLDNVRVFCRAITGSFSLKPSHFIMCANFTGLPLSSEKRRAHTCGVFFSNEHQLCECSSLFV